MNKYTELKKLKTEHGTYICENCGQEVGALFHDENWGWNDKTQRDMHWICPKCKMFYDRNLDAEAHTERQHAAGEGER